MSDIYDNGGFIGVSKDLTSTDNIYSYKTIQYVGGAIQDYAETTSDITYTIPTLTGGVDTTPQIGDLILVLFSNGSSGSGNGTVTGFTTLGLEYANSTYDTYLYVGYKFYSSAADLEITILNGTGSASSAAVIGVSVWRNVSSDYIFDVDYVSNAASNTGKPNPPAITPITAGTYIVAVGGASTGSELGGHLFSSSDLSDFKTDFGSASYSATLGFGYYQWISDTFDPNVFTLDIADGTSYSSAAFTIALRPEVEDITFDLDGVWGVDSVYTTVAASGQVEFTTPGLYYWVAPYGVDSVSVVCVGGGGGGYQGGSYARGGGGGGLGWKNNIPVIPGQFYTVVVGEGGVKSLYISEDTATDGGDSYFIDILTVAGFGGKRGGYNVTTGGEYMTGGSYVGDGGGNGGSGGYGGAYAGGGGGGAGGYSGNGGSAYITSPIDLYGSGSAGTGGGAGGGGAGGTGDTAGSGGGVGIYGEGSNGAGGGGTSADGYGGFGGSGGTDAAYASTSTTAANIYNGATNPSSPGFYGGGGGGSDTNTDENGNGGSGAVRIIWGADRAFPSTNTGDL